MRGYRSYSVISDYKVWYWRSIYGNASAISPGIGSQYYTAYP